MWILKIKSKNVQHKINRTMTQNLLQCNASLSPEEKCNKSLRTFSANSKDTFSSLSWSHFEQLTRNWPSETFALKVIIFKHLEENYSIGSYTYIFYMSVLVFGKRMEEKEKTVKCLVAFLKKVLPINTKLCSGHICLFIPHQLVIFSKTENMINSSKIFPLTFTHKKESNHFTGPCKNDH